MDMEAHTQFIRALGKRYYVLGQIEEDDVRQELWLVLLEKRGLLEDRPYPYIRQFLRTKAIDLTRKALRHRAAVKQMLREIRPGEAKPPNPLRLTLSNCKLTSKEKQLIRNIVGRNTITLRAYAVEWGVSTRTVSRIRKEMVFKIKACI